mgnify:CR=1 FL=1
MNWGLRKAIWYSFQTFWLWSSLTVGHMNIRPWLETYETTSLTFLCCYNQSINLLSVTSLSSPLSLIIFYPSAISPSALLYLPPHCCPFLLHRPHSLSIPHFLCKRLLLLYSDISHGSSAGRWNSPVGLYLSLCSRITWRTSGTPKARIGWFGRMPRRSKVILHIWLPAVSQKPMKTESSLVCT